MAVEGNSTGLMVCIRSVARHGSNKLAAGVIRMLQQYSLYMLVLISWRIELYTRIVFIKKIFVKDYQQAGQRIGKAY